MQNGYNSISCNSVIMFLLQQMWSYGCDTLEGIDYVLYHFLMTRYSITLTFLDLLEFSTRISSAS
jgi:hypothetical protein